VARCLTRGFHRDLHCWNGEGCLFAYINTRRVRAALHRDVQNFTPQLWTVYHCTPYFGANNFNVSRYMSNSVRQYRLANVYWCTHISDQWRLYIFKTIYIKFVHLLICSLLTLPLTQYLYRQAFVKMCTMNRKWSERKWSWLILKYCAGCHWRKPRTVCVCVCVCVRVCVPSEMVVANLPCKRKHNCLSNVFGIARRVRKIPKIGY